MTSGPLVVLIGPPGAGKTRIGKRVAKQLDADFVDTDARIVADHGQIKDIFARHGEPHFRRLERAAVAAALTEPAVVSLGGGAVLDPDTQADLAGLRVVLLTATAAAVEKRIRGSKRPLLTGGIEAWQALVDARRETYERLASREWDTSVRPADRIAAEIAEWVREAAESGRTAEGREGAATRD